MDWRERQQEADWLVRWMQKVVAAAHQLLTIGWEIEAGGQRSPVRYFALKLAIRSIPDRKRGLETLTRLDTKRAESGRRIIRVVRLIIRATREAERATGASVDEYRQAADLGLRTLRDDTRSRWERIWRSVPKNPLDPSPDPFLPPLPPTFEEMLQRVADAPYKPFPDPIQLSPPNFQKTIATALVDPSVRAAITSAKPPAGIGRRGAQEKADTKGRLTANDRMRKLIEKRPEANEWSARKFALALEVSKSTVHGTEMWTTLMRMRRMAMETRLDRQNAMKGASRSKGRRNNRTL